MQHLNSDGMDSYESVTIINRILVPIYIIHSEITKAHNQCIHDINCVKFVKSNVHKFKKMIYVILTKYVYFPSIRRINVDWLILTTVGFAVVSVVDGIRFAALCSAPQRVVRVFDRRGKCQYTGSYVAIRTGLLDKTTLYILIGLSPQGK